MVSDSSDEGESEGEGVTAMPLPSTIQQLLLQQTDAKFAAESDALCASLREDHDRQMTALREELVSAESELVESQKAFDVYRERARVALKQTSAEQHNLTGVNAELGGKVKALGEELTTVRTESAAQALEAETQLAAALTERGELNTELASLKEQLADERAAAASAATSRDESAAIESLRAETMAATVERARLEAKCKESVTLIAKLRAEMTKKSDAARKLLEGKDREIARYVAQFKAFKEGGGSTPSTISPPGSRQNTPGPTLQSVPVTPTGARWGPAGAGSAGRSAPEPAPAGNVRVRVLPLQSDYELPPPHLRRTGTGTGTEEDQVQVPGDALDGKLGYVKAIISGLFLHPRGRPQEARTIAQMGRALVMLLQFSAEESATILHNIEYKLVNAVITANAVDSISGGLNSGWDWVIGATTGSGGSGGSSNNTSRAQHAQSQPQAHSELPAGRSMVSPSHSAANSLMPSMDEIGEALSPIANLFSPAR